MYRGADYSAVDETIAEIPADLSIFTEATANALTAAKDAVIRGKNITEQSTVDGYATAIKNAVNDLMEKDDDSDNIPPQTGDNSNLLLLICLMLISRAGILGTSQYNKKRTSK